MAENTTERIISVTAKYETLAQMREEVARLKGEQDKLTEGTAEYESNLADLKKAQGEYNAQMRLAVKENGQVSGSYNDLVNQLARLKEQWKATADSAERAALTDKVNEIKGQLTDLDASIGNFQRNVGNYSMATGQFLGTFGENLEKARAAGTGMVGTVKNLGAAAKLLATNPIMGVLQLVLPLLMKIGAELSKNEAVMASGKKLLSSFEPILTIINKLMEKLAVVIGKVAEWAGKLIGKVVEGITGVKSEVQTATEEVVETMQSQPVVDKATKAGKDIGEALAEGINIAFDDKIETEDIGKKLRDSIKAEEDAAKRRHDIFTRYNADRLAELDKQTKLEMDLNEATLQNDKDRSDKAYDIMMQGNERRLAALRQFQQDAITASDLTAYFEYKQQADDLEVQMEVDKQKRISQLRKESRDEWISGTQSAAGSIADIMGTVAGIYEDDVNRRLEAGEITQQQAEQEFENIKAMQYSQTWINTLAGMTAALTSPAMNSLGPAGWIASAVQAASLLATGIAQTIKIKNTQLGGGGAGTAATAVQAPRMTVDVPQTRVVTNAEDEDLLNERAKSQKVYILQSDIEDAGRRAAVLDAETGF